MMIEIRPRTEKDFRPVSIILEHVFNKTGYPVGLKGIEDALSFLRLRNETAITDDYVLVDGDLVIGHMSVVKSPTTYPLQDTEIYESSTNDESRWSSVLKVQDNSYVFNCLCLRTFFVDPQHQGKRFGEKLLQHAMYVAERMGKLIVLDVIEKDTAAVALYEKLGWRKIGRTVYVEQRSKVRYHEWLYLSPASKVIKLT